MFELTCDAREQEKRDARACLNFCVYDLWWIDRFIVRPRGSVYRYVISGRNGMRGDDPIFWSVPSLCRRYAFRLEEISNV